MARYTDEQKKKFRDTLKRAEENHKKTARNIKLMKQTLKKEGAI